MQLIPMLIAVGLAYLILRPRKKKLSARDRAFANHWLNVQIKD